MLLPMTTTTSTEDVIKQLAAMRDAIPTPNHGVTREAAETLLRPLTLTGLRRVNEHFGFSVWVSSRSKTYQVTNVAENVIGCLLSSYAINPRR